MYVGMYETFSITMISANVRMGIQFRNQQGKVQINHNWFRRLIEKITVYDEMLVVEFKSSLQVEVVTYKFAQILEQLQYFFLRYHDKLLLTRQMRSRP